MCRDWRLGQAVRSIDVTLLDERLRVSRVGRAEEIATLERSFSPKEEVILRIIKFGKSRKAYRNSDASEPAADEVHLLH